MLRQNIKYGEGIVIKVKRAKKVVKENIYDVR